MGARKLVGVLPAIGAHRIGRVVVPRGLQSVSSTLVLPVLLSAGCEAPRPLEFVCAAARRRVSRPAKQPLPRSERHRRSGGSRRLQPSAWRAEVESLTKLDARDCPPGATKPDFLPQDEGISSGVIVAIVFLLILLNIIIVYCYRRYSKREMQNEM